MEKKKSIISGSLVAGAIFAVSGLTANAETFTFNHLGTGEEVRTNLLNREESNKNLELKCTKEGKSDSTMTKGKDGKCSKDGKCGEGKCGDKKDKKKDKDEKKPK